MQAHAGFGRLLLSMYVSREHVSLPGQLRAPAKFPLRLYLQQNILIYNL